MYDLIREDIVLKLEARADGEGEGIGRGDVAGHGGSDDIRGRVGVGVGERECKGGCSGEKGFGSSVKEICFFLSAVITRVFGAVWSC
jgi:hypothetical protein